MSREYLQPVYLTLRVKLASGVIEDHSAASPYIVGEELARHIAAYVQDHHTGYYPAVDYFNELGVIDPDLFSALENVSWLVTTMSKDIIRNGLRSYMRNIKFDSTQMIATTMPQVRPGVKNAMHRLALHYTPDQLRVNLHADLVEREKIQSTAILEGTKEKIKQWLDEKFIQAEVCDIWFKNGPVSEDVI